MIQDVDSADVSPAYAATLCRSVHESYFRTSKEVQEMSHNTAVEQLVTAVRRAYDAS